MAGAVGALLWTSWGVGCQGKLVRARIVFLVMKALLIAALLLCSCRSNPAPLPPAEEPVRPRAEDAGAALQPSSGGTCELRAEPGPAPAAADGLLAVAPQYFHAFHRGGFDAYRGGGDRFPWFDLTDLEHPTLPPAGVRIAASTRSAFLTVSRRGELGVMRRGETSVTWLGERLYPEDAVETTAGDVLAIARSGSTLRLARVDREGRLTARDLGLPERGRVATVGLTADDRPAVAYLVREGGQVRLMLTWTLDPAAALVVDSVDLPVPVAELSERTGVDIAIAADGEHDLAISWRPLTDSAYTDVGSASEPPTTAARAEVRWRTVAPDGSLGDLHRAATEASPLGGVTGIGPWGLAPCGAKATTLRGRALFAWIDGDSVRAARADHDDAVRLAPSEGAPLIGFRGTDEARELLLFDSSPRIRAYRLGCAAP